MKKHIDKQTVVRIVKIAIFTVLCVLLAYLTYSVIGNLVVWTQQPRFVGADGTVTCSWGFLIQCLIFSGFFVLCAVAVAVCGCFFFRKKKGPRTEE